MPDLNQAMTDIRTMRGQLARSTVFRGYGPFTVALTGGFALIAAWMQVRLLPHPMAELGGWAALWAGTAALSALAIGGEVVLRARRVHSGLADDMIQAAALQLLPAAGAGMLLGFVLWRAAPQTLWMLPGLWQILLSLGIFSACRNLPAPLHIAAFWYLCSGLMCLAFGAGAHALSPWLMGLPFGLGEFLAAGLLAISAGDESEINDG